MYHYNLFFVVTSTRNLFHTWEFCDILINEESKKEFFVIPVNKRGSLYKF